MPRHPALTFCLLAVLGSAAAAARPSSGPPAVVMLFTEPQGRTSRVVEQRGAATAEWARLEHAPQGVPRGALVDARRAAIIVQPEPARDQSWASALLVVGADGEVRQLADRVAHGSRPVITPRGEVLVTRGLAGEEPMLALGPEAPLRIDAITVELIHPDTGAARALHRGSGYLAFVAGVTAKEALIYEIGPGRMPLWAVDLDTGARRSIAAHVELGRDFSIAADGSAVTFTERALDGWHVITRPLRGGEAERVLNETSFSTAPRQLRRGLAFNAQEGPRLLTRAGQIPLPCPHPGGLHELVAETPDGRYAAGLHVEEGELPRPVLMDLDARRGAALPIIAGSRAEIVGVAP